MKKEKIINFTKKIKEYQKARILSLKHAIIKNDSKEYKQKAYNILLIALKKYHKHNESLVQYNNNISIDYKINNAKINNFDTIIFSITSALMCDSAINGYCQFYKNKKCYALKNELQYNASILYKDRQAIQWKTKKAYQLALNFIRIKKLYPQIKFLRINESGDLTIKDLKKLNIISDILKKYDIKVFSYTHNIKIDKSMVTSDNLTLNSSNKNIKLDNRFLSFESSKIERIMKIKKVNKFIKCIGDCTRCKLCTIKNKNITILCAIH